MKFPIQRTDPVAACILALGLLLRIALFLSGRNPLDGDECVLGIMGADLSRMVRVPVYFYGQHYMGALEVPLLALIQLPGPDSWRFSAWPVRLTGWIYFVLLGSLHFTLCRRFFGRAPALSALFFLCVGPLYWTDYSVRLRHAPLMLVMGEAAALVALLLREHWIATGEIRPKPWFCLGLILGAGWWHYQLIAVFFPAVALLLLIPPSPVSGLLRLDGQGSLGRLLAACVGWGLMFVSLALLVALTLGKGSMWLWEHREAIYYPHLMLAVMLLFGAGLLLAFMAVRSGPNPLFAGFLAASLPTIGYLATLKVEFWVPPAAIDFDRVLARLGDLMLIEVAGLLEIVRYTDGAVGAEIGPWTYISLAAHAAGLVVIVRMLFKPASPGERHGILFFLVLALSVLLVNVVMPRPMLMDRPRFLLPLMLSSSVVLGLFLVAAARALSGRERTAFRRRTAFGLAAGLAWLVLNVSGWFRSPAAAMDWPSGFERDHVAVVRDLETHGVRRAAFDYSTSNMLLGQTLFFVSRMTIRFNEGSLTDRFSGIYDPGDFPGPLHAIVRNSGSAALHRTVRNGFMAGSWFVYPLPSGVRENRIPRFSGEELGRENH